MRRIAVLVAGVLGAAGLIVSLAAPAGATTTKPTVFARETNHYGSCGASPDTCTQHIVVTVTGYNFTAGGDVYVDFQDITAGTAPFASQWIKAGTGSCGYECNNYGKINLSRDLSFPYGTVCGHTLRAWAWDNTKSPQLGWSTYDFQAVC